MRYSTQNYFDEGGNRLVIGGEIVINGKLSIADDADVDELVTFTATATETVTGGIKAAEAGDEDTVEVKIGEDGKAYVPAYPDYTLPAADSDTLGGVMAAAKGETDTVPAKIGTDNILYVPTYPAEYRLPDATAEAIGGVKLAANQADSTELTSPTVAEFNALLAKLKAAGIMAADEPET
jgi:hypothetical protein